MTEVLSPWRDQIATESTLPTFLGIGAQRAATTWLHECLAEHPDVFVPPGKELNYFVENFDKGPDWYQHQFDGYDGESAIGEITPSYLGDEDALPRIAAMLPEVRLFVVLRNPFDRAFSAYHLFRTRFGWNSFSEALQANDMILVHSLYAANLRRAMALYPEELIKVFFYEDIEFEPHTVVAELFRFLEVDARFVPRSLNKRYNRIVYPNAQKLLRSIGLGWAVSLAKKTPLAELVKSKAKPTERPETKDIEYLNERLMPDILDLQDLLGRDLSHWMPSR